MKQYIHFAKFVIPLLIYNYLVFCTLGDPAIKIILIGCILLVHYNGTTKIRRLDRHLRYLTGFTMPSVFLFAGDYLEGLANTVIFLSLPICLLLGFIYAGLLTMYARDYEVLNTTLDRFHSSIIRYVFLNWLVTACLFHIFAKAIYD